MAYEAVVCKVNNLRDHPNADRLKLITVSGFQVVVGLDCYEGQVGLFFMTDGQLSVEFAEANNLVGYTDPITGEHKGGFFPANRRVRSQKFRGEKSDGFFIGLDSLIKMGISEKTINSLKIGTTLTELEGKPICNKYFTVATLKAQAGIQKQAKAVPTFAKHIETAQYRYLNDIPKNSVLYISEKIHGTSGRFGLVPVKKTRSRKWYEKLLRITPQKWTEYEYLNGTRNMVMEPGYKGFYGEAEGFRNQVVASLQGNLHKGEILYFELVGFTTTGTPIMSPQQTTKLNDKKLLKQYGQTMQYKYGCLPGQCKLFVYRITQVNEDANVIELSWNQVKQRCKELGIQTVPELDCALSDNWFKEQLDARINYLIEGPSTLDPEHIREGVVIRIESEYGTDWYKQKSYDFSVLEGFLREKDEFVDLEEIS